MDTSLKKTKNKKRKKFKNPKLRKKIYKKRRITPKKTKNQNR